MIDVTGLDPLSLVELGGGFSALVSLVLLDVLGRGKIRKIEVFLTYEWVIRF